MINKVILLGNLGKDPEFKELPGGQMVCNCSLATSESWKDKDSGEWMERAEWHNLVVWGKSAQWFSKLTKGAQVYIEGKLATKSWQDGENTRYKTEVNVQLFKKLSSNSNQTPQPKEPAMAGSAEEGGDSGDDLPF